MHHFGFQPNDLPSPAREQRAALGLERWRDSVDHVEDGEVAAAARRLADDADGRRLLEALFGNSPYLTQCAVRDPGVMVGIFTRGPDAVVADIMGGLEAMRGEALDSPALASHLRTAKRHMALAVAVADIAGVWPLERVTGALSDFALESIAFAAKDALLVIDDFVPGGTSSDIARWHRKADRVLRAQGNRSGRQRMRDDTTLRAEKPPRGLILSTGEDTPRGQSLRARLFVNDLADGDLDWERITNCQEDAAAGLYAQALAGFIWWLSLQYEEVQENLRGQLNELREQVFQKGMHKRTASIIANLALGFRYFLAYAEDIGAVNEEERQVLWKRCWSALGEAAAAQHRYQSASDPVERFLELLRAAVTSGRAHLAGPDGAAPKSPQAWGWERDKRSDIWRAKGDRIGWIESEDLYLEPQAAFTVAQRMARDSGETLPIGSKTLHKRLDEKKLLKTKERDHLLVRRRLEEVRRSVLHLHPDTLLRVETAQSDQPDPKTGRGVSLKPSDATAEDEV